MLGQSVTQLLRITLTLAMLCCISLATVATRAQTTTTLTPPQQPVPDSFFDLNILFNTDSNVPWPPVPFYGWRLSHVNWPDLQPYRDKWHFDLLDKYVAVAQQHKAEVFMTLTYTPRWASSMPDAESDWPNRPGFAGAPVNMDDWRNFVRTVGTRYKGKIHVYEIWNEADHQHSWLSGTEKMIEMVREASTILKQIDPTIIILSPCPTNPAWIAEFLQKGGGQYVDVIAFHFYTPKGAPPEAVIPMIQKVKASMAQYGAGNKPLWNTEAGWHEPRPFPSDDLAAAYVVRSYALNWASGVSRFYWYCWDNHDWTSLEMITRDNSQLTPAGKAFATAQKWMVGSTIIKCSATADNIWMCALNRNGSSQYLLWNAGDERDFSLPNVMHVSHFTKLDGSVNNIANHSIRLGVQPLLLQ
jgi:Glycosyl hydrolases family 39